MRPTRTPLVPLVVTALFALAACGTSSSGAASDDAGASSAASSAASGSSDDATPAIVQAAEAFLATLSDDEKDAVLFDWSDTEQKQRWSNFPQGLYQRDGLMWGDLGTEQQDAWHALMRATLSADGYDRVLAEQAGDDTLATEPGGQGQQLGSDYYWVALIGTPSQTSAWQWQWGGHHVTVNATVSGSELSLAPSFIGIQPATYTNADGETVTPLGDIWQQALDLVTSLDAGQQATAVLGDAYIDLVLGPGEDGRTIAAEGIAGSAMTDDQQAAFLALMGKYGGLANDEDAASRMAGLEQDLDDTYFAWYGPTDGSAAYFRITGPTIVVEYSPQSMGGDAAAHVHGIYRDPTNDYGAAITS